jgi:hypothetical protein
MKNRTSYIIYIIGGLLYVVVKIGYVSAGYLHPGAIAHGAIPSVITVVAGLLALREYTSNKGNRLWHKIAVIVPVLVFIITPLFMYLKQGEQWLTNGRLSVLIIYEILAIIQFMLGARLLNREISSQ